MAVTTTVNGGVSQNYTISAKNGTIDLSKVVVRYNYTKDGNQDQSFWCDNAGLQLNESPYYVNYTSDVNAKFGDGYLELSFNKGYQFADGALTIGCRFNNSDWSAYSNFKGGNIEVYYDGQLVQVVK